MNFYGFFIYRRPPFKDQVNSVRWAFMHADLTDDAAEGIEMKLLFFLFYSNRSRRAAECAYSAKNTLVIVESYVSPGLIERFPYLNGIEPCGISGEKVF
jgi:hypothetical protein